MDMVSLSSHCFYVKDQNYLVFHLQMQLQGTEIVFFTVSFISLCNNLFDILGIIDGILNNAVIKKEGERWLQWYLV